MKRPTRILILALALAVAFELLYERLAPNSPAPKGLHVLAGFVGLVIATVIDALWARFRTLPRRH